jgi:hypothetical protein
MEGRDGDGDGYEDEDGVSRFRGFRAGMIGLDRS